MLRTLKPNFQWRIIYLSSICGGAPRGINIDNPGKISDFYDLGKTLGAELLPGKQIPPQDPDIGHVGMLDERTSFFTSGTNCTDIPLK